MNHAARTVSYDEQVDLGLIRHPSTYVPAKVGDVLPPVQAVPMGIDPYAPSMPQPVHQMVTVAVTPLTRAQAMVQKVNTVTVALAVFTLAALFMLGEFTFLLWLLIASGEWVACFILLAILDWRETPSALAWRQSEQYLALMHREQTARLKAMYGYEES